MEKQLDSDKKKQVPRRLDSRAARERNPGLPEYWNVPAIVREAAKVGLPLNGVALNRAVLSGSGPRVSATVGKMLLFEPGEVRRWLRSEIERRRPRPTTEQRKLGISEEEFGSVAA
jgi:hypothetical protein